MSFLRFPCSLSIPFITAALLLQDISTTIVKSPSFSPLASQIAAINALYSIVSVPPLLLSAKEEFGL